MNNTTNQDEAELRAAWEKRLKFNEQARTRTIRGTSVVVRERFDGLTLGTVEEFGAEHDPYEDDHVGLSGAANKGRHVLLGGGLIRQDWPGGHGAHKHRLAVLGYEA